MHRIADLTTDEIAKILATPPTCALVPVGSVEPHGPHLPLATDTIISDQACVRAVPALATKGIAAFVAPAVPYGVTEYAAGFRGATSVPAAALTVFLRAVAAAFLADGWSCVCFVNNHLEPAHDAAVRAAAGDRVVVACPLTRKWARTLTAEFKRGDCHAGQYETSLLLAAGARVLDDERKNLPTLTTSLADGIKAGQKTFGEMGLDRAYTGAPAHATREEGEESYLRLVDMIVGEVTDSLRQ